MDQKQGARRHASVGVGHPKELQAKRPLQVVALQQGGHLGRHPKQLQARQPLQVVPVRLGGHLAALQVQRAEAEGGHMEEILEVVPMRLGRHLAALQVQRAEAEEGHVEEALEGLLWEHVASSQKGEHAWAAL